MAAEQQRPAADADEALESSMPNAEADAARVGIASEALDDHEAPADDLSPTEAEQAAAEAEQAAAEALARLEDRIGAYTSYTLAGDFLELREIFDGTLERISEADWDRRTDRRTQGWTRRETLAHVEAVTEAFYQAALAGSEGRTISFPDFTARTDLPTINQAMIEARAELPVDELRANLLERFTQTARLAAGLTAEQMGRVVTVPFYGSPPTVAELIGASLAHAGIIHGAQLALNRSRPIWIYFHPSMMRRQITRLVHMLGLSYWPERGGELHATLAIHIEGQGGGSWIVRVSPEGGMGKIGLARTNDVSYTFASADLFCRLMTYQTKPWRHLLTRKLRVAGQLGLAGRVPRYFSPT
ncbi:MAG: DinB family protein [Oscillochloridaceae bacterium umkhey_bin13]